jgi:hypothetical protein
MTDAPAETIVTTPMAGGGVNALCNPWCRYMGDELHKVGSRQRGTSSFPRFPETTAWRTLSNSQPHDASGQSSISNSGVAVGRHDVIKMDSAADALGVFSHLC